MSKRAAPEEVEEREVKLRRIIREEITLDESPISLEEKAALQIAVMLWNRINVQFLINPHIFRHHSVMELSDIVIKNHVGRKNQLLHNLGALLIGKRMKNMMLKYLEHVERQMKLWILKVYQLLLFDHVPLGIHRRIVWKSNGLIDEVASAKNLVNWAKLRDIEKYSIMCQYCFEEEIANLPMEFISEIMENLEEETKRECVAMKYWYLWRKNELSTLKIGRCSSIASYMVKKSVTWRGGEYFFDQLSDYERIENATYLISAKYVKFSANVLKKLNENERRVIFQRCQASLISMHAGGRLHHLALFVWNTYGRYLGEPQMANLMTRLLAKFRNFLQADYPYGVLDEDRIALKELILSMWTNSSEDMKDYVLNDEFHGIGYILVYVENLYKSRTLSVEMLELSLNILTNCGAHAKRNLSRILDLTILCMRILGDCELEYFRRITEVCIPDINEKIRFQQRIFLTNKIVAFFRRVIRSDGNMDKLDEAFNVINFSDRNFIFNYKKTLLQPEKTLKSFCVRAICKDRFDNLNELIYNFSSITKYVNDFMIEVISSAKVRKTFRQKINNGKFDEVRLVVEQLFDREENLEIVKTKISAYYIKAMKTGKFGEYQNVQWNELLSWCLGEYGLIQFKNASVEEIFVKMLKKTLFEKYRLYRAKCSFEPIDNFLTWCLNAEKAQEFKINKILMYRQCKVTHYILRTAKDPLLNNLIRWFFCNNSELIEDFKSCIELCK